MSAPKESLRSIILALTANIAIAIAKLAAALKTGSGSMMAESIHSFSDSINQVLLLVGLKRSSRPPNDQFPLGHGKELYFYSFIVAILIFTIGGLFSLYEGIHKLHSTDPIQYPIIAISVLCFAILAEGFAFFGCLREVKKLKGQKTYREWMKQTRRTELVVILGEDFAALLGLFFALTAISMSIYTGNPVYDAIGSIGIGVLLIGISFMLSKEIKNLLIGRGVDLETKSDYISFIEQQAGIEKVLNLVSMYMGSDILLAIKIKMDPSLSSHELVNSINQTEVLLKQKYPEIYWLFVEPDNKK